MLVEVTLMRHKGQKIDREVLPTAPTKRGYLNVWRYRDQVRGGFTIVASLNVEPFSHTSQLLPRLDGARLVSLRGGDLVVTGTEIIDQPRKQPDEVYRQSWWVRLVQASGSEPA